MIGGGGYTIHKFKALAPNKTESLNFLYRRGWLPENEAEENFTVKVKVGGENEKVKIVVEDKEEEEEKKGFFNWIGSLFRKKEEKKRMEEFFE